MFFRQSMKGEGLDITLRNNPGHVLAPDNEGMALGFRFSKVSAIDFKKYYMDLLKERWATRRKDFSALVLLGKEKDIGLRCSCKLGTECCHANLAAKFLNKLIESKWDGSLG